MLLKEGGVCVIVRDSCCNYIPRENSSNNAFDRTMSQMRKLRAEVNLNSGYGPDFEDLDLSIIGLFLGLHGTGYRTPFSGSLGANIIEWILKVFIGAALLIALHFCLLTCCSKVCTGTVTNVIL